MDKAIGAGLAVALVGAIGLGLAASEGLVPLAVPAALGVGAVVVLTLDGLYELWQRSRKRRK